MAWNLQEAVAYYRRQGAPGDQSALVSLLSEVQSECGGNIPLWVLPEIAQGLGVKESFLQAVIRRMPRLRLGDTHVLEMCAGPNCGRHTALAAFAEKHKGKVELKFVPCMRLCGKGPNIKFDGKLYHRADEALLRSLLEEGNKG